MERIGVDGERGATLVVVGAGILGRLADLLREAELPVAPPVVTDTIVGPLWARDLAGTLGSGPPLELAPGEENKRWHQVEAVCRWLLRQRVHRGGALLAVGGGVLTDTAGFAASVYQRGIGWAAVTTTLLGMVDASVGGKTGVNLPEGKNLVGTFWAPRLVVADVAVLATLPPRELRAGLAEVVKAAWIGDRDLLDLLPGTLAGYGDLDPDRWCEVVARAIRVKASVVSRDERERGLRRVLNLGHTLGHALEAATAYRRFLHGEAVAWGMRAAAWIAGRRGLLSAASRRRLEAALDVLGPLPPVDDLEPGRILEHLAVDKKRNEGGVPWILPTDEGVLADQEVAPGEAMEALAAVALGGPGSR